jgi:glutathione S-transferase
MAAKRKSRAKRSNGTTLKGVQKTVRKTMNQAATRVQRKAKSLQRDAEGAATQVRHWADDGVIYVRKTIKKQPFLAGAAMSAAAAAAIGMLFVRR